ncbi:Hypothetical protein POVR1_LOCUS135 [uncultured virus]|nr:Hypothetical protein POVR1_LOCUS135 [uncultured virus]
MDFSSIYGRGSADDLKKYFDQGGTVDTFQVTAAITKFSKSNAPPPEFFDLLTDRVDLIQPKIVSTLLLSSAAFRSFIMASKVNPLEKDGLVFKIVKGYGDDPAMALVMNNPNVIPATMNMDTEEDVANLVDRLVSEEKNQIVYPIGRIYDPRVLVRYGLLPADIFAVNLISLKFFDYLNGMDAPTFRFWHDEDLGEYQDDFITSKRWNYSTLETYKRHAVTKVESIPLIFLAPELVYRSNRPVTDMATFRGPRSHTIRREKIVNNRVILNGEGWFVIPVTRYAAGMSKSLFYGESSSQYCGTFYYHEPESKTLLAYKTSRTFFNKYDALRNLVKDDQHKSMDYSGFAYVLERHPLFQIFSKHYNGMVPSDLMLTPGEMINFDPDHRPRDLSNVARTLHYAGKVLYAFEDDLDQPICTMGAEQGIDLLILEKMPGAFQIVTEVLDTRSREDSFRSLVYIVD